MTTYALDGTGTSVANHITNEVQTVLTAGVGKIAVYLTQPLFYQSGLSISYSDVNGAAAVTLALGDDYVPIFEIDGIAGTNKVFMAIRLNNLQLNGTISVSYQTLGGQWSVNQTQINAYINQNYFSARLAYLGAQPYPALYAPGQSVPIFLNSFTAVQQAQSVGPLPVGLGVQIVPLPASKQLYVENGLFVDGNGNRVT